MSAPFRLLARWGIPVTVVTVERTTNRKTGDVTTTEARKDVPLALFEPAQQSPRTDPRTPGVSSPAKFYFPPGVAITEGDKVVDAGRREWRVTSVQEWPMGVEAAVTRWGAR